MRTRVEERFGHYGAEASGRLRAGSMRCRSAKRARPAILIERLRRQYPGIAILLTNGTATGREEGAKLLRHGDLQVWQPWDSPGAVARFLDRFQPAHRRADGNRGLARDDRPPAPSAAFRWCWPTRA